MEPYESIKNCCPIVPKDLAIPLLLASNQPLSSLLPDHVSSLFSCTRLAVPLRLLRYLPPPQFIWQAVNFIIFWNLPEQPFNSAFVVHDSALCNHFQLEPSPPTSVHSYSILNCSFLLLFQHFLVIPSFRKIDSANTSCLASEFLYYPKIFWF